LGSGTGRLQLKKIIFVNVEQWPMVFFASENDPVARLKVAHVAKG